MSDTPANGRTIGRVKWFNTQRGYGFIIPDDGSRDVFVSAAKLNGLVLKEDQRCSYLRTEGKKGPWARDVTLLAGPGHEHA